MGVKYKTISNGKTTQGNKSTSQSMRRSGATIPTILLRLSISLICLDLVEELKLRICSTKDVPHFLMDNSNCVMERLNKRSL